MKREQIHNGELQDNIKAGLQKKYRAILSRQLTPANIDNFADEALKSLITLTKEVTESYAREKNLILPEHLGRDLEDEAFRYYEIQNVSLLLEKAQEKLETLGEVSDLIEHLNWQHIEEIITPPEKNKNILPGNGEFTRDMIPRLKTLLYILKERGVALEKITLLDGIVTTDMVRQTSYVTIVIPEIDRLAQICDEEGNASYAFKLSGIDVETINRMTKTEKNNLITDHPGIGVRFHQGLHWRERTESYLFEEIPDGRDEEEMKAPLPANILRPVYGEFDPWSRFATDEDGRHWGTRAAIARRLGKSFVIFRKRIQDSRLEIRPVVDAIGRPQNGYCFEQLVQLFPELFTQRQPEKEGEWRGFWLDTGTGRHWSTGGGLMRKFEVNDWITIKRYANQNNLSTIKIIDLKGREADAYCYEDFLEIEDFMEFLTAPEVEQEGDWMGYWIDDAGKHWAPVGILANHFSTTNPTINQFAHKGKLNSKKLKSRTGEIFSSFCREDLGANREFMEFIQIPKVDPEGQWIGFWTDASGNHWGPKRRLAQKLATTESPMSRLIARHPELSSQPIKDSRGKVWAGFCYEDIKKIIES